MDDKYVILAIFILVLFTFIILFAPSPFKTRHHHKHHDKKHGDSDGDDKKIHHIKHPEVKVKPANKDVSDANKLVCYDARMQTMNSKKIGNIGDKQDEETLSSFYKPATEHVPVNFPIKPVEQCAAAKPQSSDLPIVDMPMCIINKHDYNMRLIY
jgi:hypothetical protein